MRIRQVEIKAVIQSEKKPRETYYLYDKFNRIILPIHCRLELRDNFSTYNHTLKAVISTLESEVVNILIHLYLDGIFYTHLTIKHKETLPRINISIEQALVYAQINNVKIFVTEDILYSKGIKITKELLMRSLSTTS